MNNKNRDWVSTQFKYNIRYRQDGEKYSTDCRLIFFYFPVAIADVISGAATASVMVTHSINRTKAIV